MNKIYLVDSKSVRAVVVSPHETTAIVDAGCVGESNVSVTEIDPNNLEHDYHGSSYPNCIVRVLKNRGD